jgi:hypothetical protein
LQPRAQGLMLKETCDLMPMELEVFEARAEEARTEDRQKKLLQPRAAQGLVLKEKRRLMPMDLLEGALMRMELEACRPLLALAVQCCTVL